MTRKRKYKKRYKKRILDYIAIPHLDIDSETKKGIFIIFILALGAISLLGLFDSAGIIGVYLKNWLILAFGWGKWTFPIILIVFGYMLYNENRFDIRLKNYLGIILFILSFHALLFLFVEYDKWDQVLANGGAGGYIGLILANISIKMLGFYASLLLMLSLIIASVLLVFDTTLYRLFGSESIIAKIFYPIKFIFVKLFKKNNEEENNKEEEEYEEEEEEEEEDDKEEENEEEEEDDEEEEKDDEEKYNKNNQKIINNNKNQEKEEIWWKPTGLEINLPLNLLNSKRNKPTSGDIKENKEIIKKTLANFKIQVEMGDVSIGPTVTQYTFKPTEGVKLSRITNLNNDLALALAAHPIRIEAPIPGKSLVGIEVPNQSKAIVSLKEILSSKNYKQRKNNSMIALGKDVAGEIWFDDITKMPHLLIAGATNSGKSVCLNTIIVSLMYQNNPDDLRFIMVDPKRVELTAYKNTPYLLTPVITNVNKTVNALKWCLNEMDRRYDILSKIGTKNIQNYNKMSKMKMPYIIFVIDELADLMVTAPKEIEASVIRLAQMARAVGIHLILATQRPSVDVITGLIKANMPARIAFSVASGIDSRTILDSLGAEKLLGQGDMLFQNAEISKPVRLQGAFLGEKEIKRIIKYTIKKAGKIKYLENITERQKVQGNSGIGLDGTKGDEDELMLEAKELIISTKKASATFLQRKLRIGYARAASILDGLEEAGVIGPSRGSKPREILISKEEFEAVNNQAVSGMPVHNRDEAKAPDEYFNNDYEDSSENPPVFEEENEDENEDENKNEDEDKDENIEVKKEKNIEKKDEEDDEDELDEKYFSK